MTEPQTHCVRGISKWSLFPRSPAVVLVVLTIAAAASLDVVSGQSVAPLLQDSGRRLSGAAGNEDKTVPFNSWHNFIETLRYGLAFVIVLVAAHPLGLLFPKYFKLPLITGYLVIGIIAGPFVANLLTEGLVEMLSNYVSALALSFISFQAGQEIYWPELRPQLKSIMLLLGALYMTAMVILTTAVLVTESAFFYKDLIFNCQLGIALMFGSISVLGSPATVMAIKIELNSVGPFTNLMLGATMIAEFVVLVSFSISRIVCSIYCAELDVSVGNLLFTLSVVMSNVLVGIVLAGLTFAIFQIPGGEHHEHYQPMDDPNGLNESPSASMYYDQKTDPKAAYVEVESTPQAANRYTENVESGGATARSSSFLTPQTSLYLKGFIWLSMGYIFYISTNIVAKATDAAFGLSWEVKFEPLLVLMVAACIAGHHSAIRHDMHVILDTAAPYMFLPFFVMTGAALKLDQVVHAIPLMTVYVLLRYIAIFVACYVGGRFLLKLPPRQYNNLWLTMTPQAGVALGLANEVKVLSDDTWAADFAATIVAAVVVNQIIGPVLCAIGLGRAGETSKDRLPDDNEAKTEADSKEFDFEDNVGVKPRPSRLSVRCSLNHRASTLSIVDNVDSRALLQFCQVHNAVVIGDDEVAFEIALELSLYGARVNVPLLDQERTSKWQKMNEAILHRAAKGDLISYKNTLKDRDNAQAMSSADVLIFTGDSNRTRENVQMLKSLLGKSHPRMIAFVPDCKFSKEMKAHGVLVIQPSIALANIATRMALLEPKMAEALSNEISTTSDFSTASYFLGGNGGDLADLHLDGRRMALGRSVVNHHSVDYDRLLETLASARLPPPPPPSRVAMFGTSAATVDPFSTQDSRSSFFVVHDGPEERTSHVVSRSRHRVSIPTILG